MAITNDGQFYAFVTDGIISFVYVIVPPDDVVHRRKNKAISVVYRGRGEQAYTESQNDKHQVYARVAVYRVRKIAAYIPVILYVEIRQGHGSLRKASVHVSEHDVTLSSGRKVVVALALDGHYLPMIPSFFEDSAENVFFVPHQARSAPGAKVLVDEVEHWLWVTKLTGWFHLYYPNIRR
jgi:hypothetical protein